jgi:hypothetical protein
MATAHALTPSDWPKIDLPRHNLVGLSIHWPILDEQQFKEVFADLLDNDGDFFSAVLYRRSKVEHRRVQLVSRTSDDNEYFVWLRFDARGDWLPGPLPKRLQWNEAAFVERLQEMRSFGAARCRAEFEYPEGNRYDTVFPLPFKLDAPGEYPWPIDEIRGVRGVKHDPGVPGRPRYRFTLDRSTDESISLLLMFELPLGPSVEAPALALKAATDIAAEFVIKNRSAAR